MSKLSVFCLQALHRALRHPWLAVPLGTAAHACLIGLLVVLIAATTANPALALPGISHGCGQDDPSNILSQSQEASGSAPGIRWADWTDSTSESVKADKHLQMQMFLVAEHSPGSKSSNDISRSGKEVTQCEASAVTCTPFVAATTSNDNCCMSLEKAIAGADSSPPTTIMPLALNQRQPVRRPKWLRLPTRIYALSNLNWKAPQLSYQAMRDVLRETTLPQPILQITSFRSFERSRWVSRSGLLPC
jgi:hypothetical protein